MAKSSFDLLGANGVARRRKPKPCDRTTARKYLRAAYDAGVPGVFMIDNGDLVAAPEAVPHIFVKRE